MSTTNEFSFLILPATLTDSMQLDVISPFAFESDNLIQMLIQKGQEQAFLHGYSRLLMRTAHCTVLNATENVTGKIVGWAFWCHMSHGEATNNDGEDQGTDPGSIRQNERLIEMENMKNIYPILEKCKVRKCMVLEYAAVLPLFQKRGIGAALVKWGTAKADAESLPCWALASPAGYRVYERVGFVGVERQSVDLDKYASGPGPENGKWGVYTE